MLIEHEPLDPYLGRNNIDTCPERSPSEDLWEVHFDALTLTGYPGTGKTALATALSRKYGIRSEKVGNRFREIVERERGTKVYGYEKLPQSFDEELEKWQKDLIFGAYSDGPLILEGRAAPVNAVEAVDLAEVAQIWPARVIRVLLTAELNESLDRVVRRETKDNPGLDPEKLKRDTLERQRRDLTKYRKLHPIVRRKNILDPNCTDIYGRSIHDLVIDTTGLTVPEVVDVLHEELVRRDLVTGHQMAA